eukprot:jgi/Botrbrau1/14838/Bobra.0278s0008.1
MVCPHEVRRHFIDFIVSRFLNRTGWGIGALHGEFSRDCVRGKHGLMPAALSGGGINWGPQPHIIHGLQPPTSAIGLLNAYRAASPYLLGLQGSGSSSRHLLQQRSVFTSALLAKNADDATDVAPGSLAFFLQGSKLQIATISGIASKGKWILKDSRQRIMHIKAREVQYVYAGAAVGEDLETLESFAAEAADPSLLHLAWEMTQEEGQVYDLRQMATFLFGSDSPGHAFATLMMLSADSLLFKQTGKQPPSFQPRPPREVKQLQDALAAQKRKEKEVAECVQGLLHAYRKPYPEKPSPNDWLRGPWAPQISALEDVMLERADEAIRGIAYPILKALRAPLGSLGAQEVLEKIGFVARHELPAFRKAGLTVNFPLPLDEAAAELAAEEIPDPDAAIRVDLRQLTVVTIDDEWTKEVDDGLSLERLEDGTLRMWVHVADPTRWLPHPAHPLCSEAERRTRTLYLPTGPVTMFPRQLAHEKFSLLQGQDCCAMSVALEVDEEGALSNCGVYASLVHVTQRLSYDESNRVLSDPDSSHPLSADLAALHEVAKRRAEWRKRAGAVNIELPETDVVVDVAEDGEAWVSFRTRMSGRSPAQALVAELMILANEAVGTLGGKAGIPLPYRGQLQAVLPSEEEVAEIAEPLCIQALHRSRMTRGQMSAEGPMPHAGLGLPAYVQFTSPIRRYHDMLAHWQLKAYLNGWEAPFEVRRLSLLLDELAASSRSHLALEKDAFTYWMSVYFSQALYQGRTTFPALLLSWIRQDTGFANVLLEEEGVELAMYLIRPRSLGDRFLVHCQGANPTTSYYWLSDLNSDISPADLGLDDSGSPGMGFGGGAGEATGPRFADLEQPADLVESVQS